MDYTLNIKWHNSISLTKEQAYGLMQQFEKLWWRGSMQVNIGNHAVWYFRLSDMSISQRQNEIEKYSNNRGDWEEIRQKREKWTDDKIATMSQEEKLYYTRLAYAYFGRWRASCILNWDEKSFLAYIKEYIRILIRWKWGYRDKYNTYNTDHFNYWDRDCQRPDLLPKTQNG
jgi:hypothetical protein